MTKGYPETYADVDRVPGPFPSEEPKTYTSEDFAREHDGMTPHDWASSRRDPETNDFSMAATRAARRPPPHTAPGRLLSRVLSGSYAYGTQTSDSDADFRGVFQLPNEDFLGLTEPKTTHQEPPDQTYHEVGHYMRLLLKGNPNIVELLWVPADCVVVTSPAWDMMREKPEMWLTRPMAFAYRGWIFTELRSLSARDAFGYGAQTTQVAKRLSHVMRMALSLETVVKSRTLTVRFAGWRLEKIMNVKLGLDGIEAVMREVARVMEEVEPSLTTMPEAPTEAALAMLLELRGYM